MKANQIDTEFSSLRMRGQVLSEMNHAYLSNWLGLPNLEIFQLQTATAILDAAQCSPQEVDLMAKVLLLIHHGLLTHEHIEQSNPSDERFRQLQVLAGDYYSSKYFQLLASSGKVEMVGTFAEAITRINEAKVERNNLFKLKGQSAVERYLFLGERIHGELLFVLTLTYFSRQPMVQDLVRVFVQTYMLAQEYSQFLAGQYSGNLTQLYALSHATREERKILTSLESSPGDSRVISLHVKYGTSSFLYEHVLAGLETAKSLLSIQESSLIRESFKQVYEYLQQTFQDTQQIVEER